MRTKTDRSLYSIPESEIHPDWKSDDTLRDLAKEQRRLERLHNKARARESELKRQLDAHEMKMYDELKSRDLDSIRIHGMNYTRSQREFVEVYDFDRWIAGMVKRKEFDMIRKQCNIEAARERWTQGIDVPGIRRGTKPALSVSRARS